MSGASSLQNRPHDSTPHLTQLGLAFPALSHLSLSRSLHVEEIKPPPVTGASIRRARAKAAADAEEQRNYESRLRDARASIREMYEAPSSGSEAADSSNEAAMSDAEEEEASGTIPKSLRVDERRRLPPHHTSVAGWAALIGNLPHGLFSIDVSNNTLSYASYALLRENVSELRAGPVLSPAVLAARTAAALRADAASRGNLGATKSKTETGGGSDAEDES